MIVNTPHLVYNNSMTLAKCQKKRVRAMEFFTYGEKEIEYLRKKDKALGAAIERIGHLERRVNPDLFSELISAVVGQQISIKAAATVWGRMTDGLGEITPQAILNCSEDVLQSFGLSFRKAGYIRGAAHAVADGTLDIDSLRDKTDDEVAKELVKLNGIGLWTAEMLMLFSMGRPNILSFGDLAIHRGMRELYRHKKVTRELFEKYRKRYSPYGSVASLYLWEISGGEK